MVKYTDLVEGETGFSFLMVFFVHEIFAIIEKMYFFITSVCKFFSFLCHYFVAIPKND